MSQFVFIEAFSDHRDNITPAKS